MLIAIAGSYGCVAYLPFGVSEDLDASALTIPTLRITVDMPRSSIHNLTGSFSSGATLSGPNFLRFYQTLVALCALRFAGKAGKVRSMAQRIRVALAAMAAACFAFAAHAAEEPRQIVGTYKVPEVAITAPVPADTTLHLAIGLTPRDEAGLAAFAAAVSDPKSPQFRHFLTLNQLTERFGPTAADYQALIVWAQSKHLVVERQYPHRLLLALSGRAADVEQAFAVKLGYAKRPDGTSFYRPDRLPSLDLAVRISHLAGLDNQFIPRHFGGSQLNGTAYGSSDLRNAYAAGCLGLTGAGQSAGLLDYAAFDPKDITDYETANNIPAPGPLIASFPVPSSYTPVPVPDPTAPNPDLTADETSADIQLLLAMAPGLTQVVVYQPDPNMGGYCTPGDEAIALWPSAPEIKVFSISVGFCPSDSINTFQIMAGMGQSVFASSGDAGTGYNSSGNANFNWFGGNADVTAVGGTVLSMNGAGKSYNGEAAWAFSGGGVVEFPGNQCTPGCVPGSSPQCSNICIPSWQAGVGNAQNGASNTYDNVPDVAMPAQNVFIEAPVINSSNQFNGDSPTTFCGTSASSPLMAGFTALAEQQNCSNFPANCANGTGLGFVSPALYAVGFNANTYKKSFNDVIGNSSDTTSCGGLGQAAPAVTGYDLATGWGSPKCGLIAQLTCTQCSGSTASAGTPGSNSCINFQTDSNHCGTCGNVCALNAGCVNGTCKIGATHGDTHLITFDGLHYDFQAAGDYVLTRAGKDFEVQTRQANGAPLWPLASVNKAVAARFGDTRVAICLAPTQLYVNGKAASLDDGKSLDAGPGVTVSRSGDTYTFVRKDGESVQAQLNSRGVGLGFRPDWHPFDENWIDVQVSLGRNPAGPVTGLLGNGDGLTRDDIAPRNGLPLVQPVPFTSLYKKFGDTWRVPADESILCDTPKVAPSDPARPFVAADLPAIDTARARAYCENAGVTNTILLEDCTLDTVVLDTPKAALINAVIQAPIRRLPILDDLPK
jgi:hypothetical protein